MDCNLCTGYGWVRAKERDRARGPKHRCCNQQPRGQRHSSANDVKFRGTVHPISTTSTTTTSTFIADGSFYYPAICSALKPTRASTATQLWGGGRGGGPGVSGNNCSHANREFISPLCISIFGWLAHTYRTLIRTMCCTNCYTCQSIERRRSRRLTTVTTIKTDFNQFG